MALDLKTDPQNIKDCLLKCEECNLYKEESGKQYVIRLLPLHAPLSTTTHALIRNEDNCYFQLRSWVISELEEQDSYIAQVNIQLNDGIEYHFIGIKIEIELITQIDELSFTKFTNILDKNMNYLKPFSSF